MEQILVLVSGALISIMILINGSLTSNVGMYHAAVVIHAVGVVFAFVLCLCQRETIFKKRNVPFWSYLGGAVGVLTVLFNNYAFSYLSMTSIVALALFGQCAASNLIDSFGLFGMTKRPMSKGTWTGFFIACIGIAVMIQGSAGASFPAVLLSLFAGITVVLSRTINAKLAETAGAMTGSFFNHLAGLPFCIILVILMPKETVTIANVQPWMLLGGAIGVLMVYLLNITVTKVPGQQLTILSFLGQIFTGFIIDLCIGNTSSVQMLYGGIAAAAGLLMGKLLDGYELKKQRTVSAPIAEKQK